MRRTLEISQKPARNRNLSRAQNSALQPQKKSYFMAFRKCLLIYGVYPFSQEPCMAITKIKKQWHLKTYSTHAQVSGIHLGPAAASKSIHHVEMQELDLAVSLVFSLLALFAAHTPSRLMRWNHAECWNTYCGASFRKDQGCEIHQNHHELVDPTCKNASN